MDYEGIYPIETIKGKNHIRYFQMDFNLDLIGNSPAWDFPMGSYTANFEFQWDHDFLLNFQEDIFCWAAQNFNGNSKTLERIEVIIIGFREVFLLHVFEYF